MTDPEQDEAFESYLKRRSVLPDAPPDDRLEPPAALDAFVLTKAREAIKAQAAPDTGKQQMQRAPRWAVPVALAATIMLCLSVVINISLNTNRSTQRLTAARDDGDRRESVTGGIPSREVILPEAKVAAAPAPRAPVVAEQQGLGASAPGPSARMAAAPSAAPSPPPGAPATAAPGAGESGSRELKRTLTASDGFARGTQAAPADASERAPAYAESASAPAADEPRVVARSAADKATVFGRRADASMRKDAPTAAGAAATTEASATAGDRATAAAAEGPSAAGAGTVARGALQSSDVGSQVDSRAAAADGTQVAAASGAQADAAGRAQAPAASRAQAAAADVPKHPADPKAWLRQIDALRAAGKNELADAEMGRFRAAFPGYAAKPAPPASSEPPK